MESNTERVDIIERKFDLGTTLDERIARISAVMPEEIQEAAKKYLPRNREDGKYVLLIRDPLKNHKPIGI